MLALLGLAACASTPPRNPLPADLLAAAEVPGIPCGRQWALDARPDPARLERTVRELEAAYPDRFRSGGDAVLSLMSLSGGADQGAFGAGFMRGWTESGTRPEFTIVTGVSTGALSAPFVFLGPDYDDDLAKVYRTPLKDVAIERSLLAAWETGSVFDTTPLFKLIQEFADEDFLDAIAREHAKGRRLFVQSTSLDAKRPVLWDLGCIASSDAPDRAEVFHKALLASASIPVAFPPVRMEVEAGGARYDELHADGGVISQTTSLGSLLVHLGQPFAERGYSPRRVMYVIRNGRLLPRYKVVEQTLEDLSNNAVSTMISVSGATDLVLAYELAAQTDFTFQATWIAEDFTRPYSGPFDPAYMEALQAYGHQRFKSGKPWADRLFLIDLKRHAAGGA